jgi:hypothetical protein
LASTAARSWAGRRRSVVCGRGRRSGGIRRSGGRRHRGRLAAGEQALTIRPHGWRCCPAHDAVGIDRVRAALMRSKR